MSDEKKKSFFDYFSKNKVISEKVVRGNNSLFSFFKSPNGIVLLSFFSVFLLVLSYSYYLDTNFPIIPQAVSSSFNSFLDSTPLKKSSDSLLEVEVSVINSTIFVKSNKFFSLSDVLINDNRCDDYDLFRTDLVKIVLDKCLSPGENNVLLVSNLGNFSKRIVLEEPEKDKEIRDRDCNFKDVVIKSDDGMVFYKSDKVYGDNKCLSIKRFCNNGVLNGSSNYKYLTCKSLELSPSKFSFKPALGVNSSIDVFSDRVQISGFSGELPISVSGPGSPSFRINDGDWRDSGFIKSGDFLEVMARSPSTPSSTIYVSVKVGGYSTLWKISTSDRKSCSLNGVNILDGGSYKFFTSDSVEPNSVCVSETRVCEDGVLTGNNSFTYPSCFVRSLLNDTSPLPFTFTNVTGSDLNVFVSSESVVLDGFDGPLEVFVYGLGTPVLSIDGGSSWNSSYLAYPGDSLQVGLTSSSSELNKSEVIISLGDYSTSWSVETRALSGCLLDGVSLSSGSSGIFYNSSLFPFGSSCVSESRLCNDGVLLGNGDFIFSSCSVEPQDISPLPFTFTNVSGSDLNVFVSSESVVLDGFDGPLEVSVSGEGSPVLSIDGSSSWNSSYLVYPGNSLQVGLTSSSSELNKSEVIISLGDYSTSWSVETLDTSNNNDEGFEGQIDSRCYTASLNTLGKWEGCNGMLIVDRAMLDNAIANNPINGGEDYYITYNGVNYTFGDSQYNIFTGQVTEMSNLFKYEINFNSNINYWDVSSVTDMSRMFFGASSFNQPLDSWDVSGVTYMGSMFYGASSFNQPLDSWDVSGVTDMKSMFYSASSFNQPLDNWDVSGVTNMWGMFSRAFSFNQPLNNWDVSRVTYMGSMFFYASSFNQPLNNWNVSSVTNMDWMFKLATSFNQSLNSWDVSSVTDMGSMFYGASSFNQPLDSWDVSSVTDMRSMFYGASSFNQPLDSWDVSGVTDMSYMFRSASSFNQPLNNWNVSHVTDMSYMFYSASSFNQPLSNWDVSSVNTTKEMFAFASSFNQPLDNWDVSGVTDMSYMFRYAYLFNQPLSNWDVSGVTDMRYMFRSASSFNQPLDNWDVSGVTDMNGMFASASSFNQPLNSWDVSGVTNMNWMFKLATSFNQPLDNWDVSGVTDMNGMFASASSFNQDLSSWNVTGVTSCFNFDYKANSWTLPKPNFVNC